MNEALIGLLAIAAAVGLIVLCWHLCVSANMRRLTKLRGKPTSRKLAALQLEDQMVAIVLLAMFILAVAAVLFSGVLALVYYGWQALQFVGSHVIEFFGGRP